MRSRTSLLLAFVSILSAGTLASSLSAQEIASPEVPFPKNDVGLATLPARKRAQLESVDQFKVFYQFHFADHLKESGITFRNRAVPYATSQYMPVHYDHGTGIAVADVDGDGRYDIYFVNQLGGNELWRNLGNGKFENITEKAGVGLKTASALRPHSAMSTTPGIRISSSPPSMKATLSFNTMAMVLLRTLRMKPAWIWSLILPAHFSLTTTTMAWSICSSATSGFTPPAKKGRRELTSASRMRSPAISIPNASSTLFFTRIWATISSRMSPLKWDSIRAAGAATQASPI